MPNGVTVGTDVPLPDRARNLNSSMKNAARNVLVIDIGGTGVKVLATGESEPRKFPSGPGMTPALMVAGVQKLIGASKYDVVSIGYPGPVRHGRPIAEPHNLAPGWVAFDYEAAFQRPVKIINDAAMQALGSYDVARCFSSDLAPVSVLPW